MAILVLGGLSGLSRSWSSVVVTASRTNVHQAAGAGDGATGLHGLIRGSASTIGPQLPLSFEANRGQAPPGVSFLAHLGSSTLYLTRSGAVLACAPTVQLNRFTLHSDLLDRAVPRDKPAVVRFSPLGASVSGGISGMDPLPGKANYFIGNDPAKWHTDIPTFQKIVYRNAYPGIDLTYHGTISRLEYDLVVYPGANARRIRFRVTPIGYQGLTSISRAGKPIGYRGTTLISREGKRVPYRPPTLIVYQNKLVAYQVSNGSRKPVAAGYSLDEGGVYSLRLGRYDRTKKLVIDPVLEYSSYLGGSGDDVGNAVRVDGHGNMYLDGFTTSPDFPTKDAIQAHYAHRTCPALTAGKGRRPCFDAFITKLNSNGTAIMYSTFLGGNGDDFGGGMALDGSRNLYVTGWTNSSNFPTVSALQRKSIGGMCRTNQHILIRCREAFVAKLSAKGDRLLYSTYLGGKGLTDGWGIAVDKAGNAYVAGSTLSRNFPVVHALQKSYAGGGPGRFDSGDVFVSKLVPHGNRLVYSTYLGGHGADGAPEIAIDGKGNAYVAGVTFSDNFPTVQPFQRHRRGDADAFITKINRQGTGIAYSSYLGGSGAEFPSDIALDRRNNVYVGGVTSSSNFPTTAGAYQRRAAGGGDGWLAKVNPRGGLVYSTLIEGKGYDSCEDITVDLTGDAYCVGITQSADFPHKQSLQPFHRGNANAFLLKLDHSGGRLVYSSFLGARGHTEATAVTLDKRGNVYVLGVTVSTSFPTVHPLQAHLKGARDLWFVKINEKRVSPVR